MAIQRSALVAALIAVTAQPALALDIKASASLQAEHSDNVTKRAENEQSDLKSTASAGIALNHAGEAVTLDLAYDANRIMYKQDTLDDETRVTGKASLVYEQIDNTLVWNLENSRKNVVKDKSLVDIENNREDRSISSIRPDLILRPSEVDTITTSISYVDIRYEDTDGQDSERLGGRLNWSHALSKVDSFGVGLNYDEVEFDQPLFDYDYYLYTINYQARLSKLAYSIALGVNESKRETDDYDGQYLNISANYELSGSLLSLNLLQELTDTSRGSNNQGLNESSNAFELVDVFERRNAELVYQNQNLCSACTVDLALVYEEETYEILPRDNDELRAAAGLGYQWTRLISLGLDVSWQDVDFSQNSALSYQGQSYKTSLNWQLLQELSLGFFVAYEEREYDLELRDYDELKGGVSLRYNFD